MAPEPQPEPSLVDREQADPAPGQWPTVSVVIPARNESLHIEECVRAFLAQDYPPERLDIVVADGESEDGTRGILDRLAREFPGRVRWVDNPRRILASGANAAIRAAEGELLLRFDAHALPSAGYVRRLVEVAQETGAGVVGGTMWASGKTPWQKTIALAHCLPFGVGGAKTRYATAGIHDVRCITCAAYRREVFDKVGLYDETLVRNQDLDLARRIGEAGFRTLLVGDTGFTHYARRTLRELAGQQFQNGWWSADLIYRGRSTALMPRHFVPALFVAGLLALAVGSVFSGWAKIALGAVVGLYLLANLVFSVGVTLRHGLAHGLRIPLVFATMHFSHGLGALWGLLTIPLRLHTIRRQAPKP